MKVEGSSGLLGAVGAVIIGSAILLFVCTIVLGSLKDTNIQGDITNGNFDAENVTPALNRAAWNSSNATFDQIRGFLTVSSILLAVLGIVMIGAAIIRYIGGAFGA